MALPTSATIAGSQGAKPMAPQFTDRLSHAGDDAYPAGGSADYTAFINARLFGDGSDPGKRTLLDVTGYGVTAGAVSHFVQYDVANDKLVVYLLAGAEVTGATDLSTTTFDLAVTSR